jgi:integrase
MAKSAKHKALTVKRIERLKNQPGRYRDGSGEVKGLYLQVESRTNVSWLLRYQQDGKERWMGLGPLETVTLKQAREKAVAARQQLKDGTDPIAAKKEAKAARAVEAAKTMTFGECAKGYIEANQASWKNPKHADQWRMTLLGIDPRGKPAKHDYCKTIRDLPVGAVKTTHVLKVVQPIWIEKTETASRLRGRIEKVLDRAGTLDLRAGENPARWVGHLDQLLPKKSEVSPVENHPALPYARMFEFMTDLRRREGMGARALEYTILTAARTNDTIGGKWSEIDEGNKLWTIPKDRIKGKKGARKRDHVIPLTRQALAVLVDLGPFHADGDYLFPGGNAGDPLSNAAMSAVIDRMNEDRVKAGLPKWVDPQQDGREIVPHGFRSSFKDWCTEVTDYPSDMSEMALAHTLPDKTEAAYRRGTMQEKRRRLMAEWAAYCESTPARQTVGAEVIPIRGGEAVS